MNRIIERLRRKMERAKAKGKARKVAKLRHEIRLAEFAAAFA
jgi:hypothetical protein